MATDETRAEASHPHTAPARLQELTNDPELWPLIAANPNAYDSLLAWLDQVGGDDVKAALAARGSAQPTTVQPAAAPLTPPPGGQPTGLPQPGGYGPPSGYGAPAGGANGGGSNKVLWIVLGIVAFLLVGSGVGVGVWALTKDDDSTKDDKQTSDDDSKDKDDSGDRDKKDDKDDDKKSSDEIDCDELEDLYDAAYDLTGYYPGIDDESVLTDAVETLEAAEGHDNKEIANAIDILLEYAAAVEDDPDLAIASEEWGDALDGEFALEDLLSAEC